MNIKGILFDLDGTLANTLPLCINIYKQSFERYTGKIFTDDEVTAHFGLTEAGIFRRVLPEQWEEALNYYHESYKARHDECQEPFSGIEQALSLLQQRGIKMAVVTGKGFYTAEYTLKYLGIAHYFSALETGQEQQIAKASAICKIVDDWQIKPEEAAYIGDADTDITEAIKAGVLPLAAEWAETATIHRLNGIEPYARFSSIEEFTRWISRTIEPHSTLSQHNAASELDLIDTPPA